MLELFLSLYTKSVMWQTDCHPLRYQYGMALHMRDLVEDADFNLGEVPGQKVIFPMKPEEDAYIRGQRDAYLEVFNDLVEEHNNIPQKVSAMCGIDFEILPPL